LEFLFGEVAVVLQRAGHECGVDAWEALLVGELTQYLQLALGISPLRAAAWSLLPSLAVAGASPLATSPGQRRPRGTVMGGAFLIAASGFLVLTRLGPTSPLVVVIIGAGTLAFGLVMILTLVTELLVGTVAPERAGAASALMETRSEFGGALGIAVLGSIGAAVYASRIGPHLPSRLSNTDTHRARQGLAGAIAASAHLRGKAARTLLTTARAAFIDGMNVVAWVGIVVLVIAAATTVTLLRRAD
jgi:DHA2 family multidrug resistance protein-like MFS transporter